ncbi:unnamed protein product [Meloidogyne enterolobii]|uniref:Uncharacterized protein n=1 Tax=Meloidogyne enterolobii TaxID=390850 RepID=A0ACB1B0A5_MELEN
MNNFNAFSVASSSGKFFFFCLKIVSLWLGLGLVYENLLDEFLTFIFKSRLIFESIEMAESWFRMLESLGLFPLSI